VELLARAKLVALDPSAQFGPRYAVAEDPTGAIIGVAGYERYGADILLRSVAVLEVWRSRGVGRQITEDRLADAASKGCRTAYLLTDAAKAFWERYGVVSRLRFAPFCLRGRDVQNGRLVVPSGKRRMPGGGTQTPRVAALLEMKRSTADSE
jgi:GNAT superfamily N-acetyltransferase